MGFCANGLKNEFETAVVNEPSVFEPQKFYCIIHVFITFLCSNSIGYDNPDFGIRRYLQLNDVNIVTDDIFTSNLASKCSVFIIKFYSVCNVSEKKVFEFHPLSTQWAFGAIMMSYRRRCDVITSHRR